MRESHGPVGHGAHNSGGHDLPVPRLHDAKLRPRPGEATFVPTTIMGYDPDVATPAPVAVQRHAAASAHARVDGRGAYVGNRASEGFAVRDNNLAVWTPTASTGNVDARRPDQAWRGINLIATDMNETYDAAQIAATLRHGPTFARLTYVYQHYLTRAADQAQEVGINNSPQRLGGQPPRHRRRDGVGGAAAAGPRASPTTLPGFSNRTAELFLGGWQMSGNFTWYDGDRLNVTLGRDNNVDGFTPDRPDQVGDIKYVRKANGTVTTWIDKTAFVNPPGPSADQSLSVRQRAAQRRAWASAVLHGRGGGQELPDQGSFVLQMRADAKNLLNRPNLSNPNMNFSSADFGLIRTKTGGGRMIQLQTKLCSDRSADRSSGAVTAAFAGVGVGCRSSVTELSSDDARAVIGMYGITWRLPTSTPERFAAAREGGLVAPPRSRRVAGGRGGPPHRPRWRASSGWAP